MNLGDYFPDANKKSLLMPSGKIEVGMVIRAFVNFTTPPKEKIFIVVGHHEDNINLVSVFFNTEINFSFNDTPELAAQHLLFTSESRPYLKHDCYVDCARLHPINKNDIIAKMDKDVHRVIIGRLEEDDLELVMSQIRNSPVIKGRIKKKCGIYDYPFK